MINCSCRVRVLNDHFVGPDICQWSKCDCETAATQFKGEQSSTVTEETKVRIVYSDINFIADDQFGGNVFTRTYELASSPLCRAPKGKYSIDTDEVRNFDRQLSPNFFKISERTIHVHSESRIRARLNHKCLRCIIHHQSPRGHRCLDYGGACDALLQGHFDRGRFGRDYQSLEAFAGPASIETNLQRPIGPCDYDRAGACQIGEGSVQRCLYHRLVSTQRNHIGCVGLTAVGQGKREAEVVSF